MKITLLTTAMLLGFSLGAAAMADEVPYGVGDWPESFGNHRARIQVNEKADAVWAHIPWRRRDAKPELKDIIIVDAATNQPVKNILRVAIRRESGDLLFQPATVPGEYHVYYLPSKSGGHEYCPTVTYPPPSNTAAADWTKSAESAAKRIAAGDTAGIPAAKVLEFQAINEFHRFDPMEIPATAEETAKLIASNRTRAHLFFPEDRRHPIRMTEAVPLRWIQTGPSDVFHGEACRGEFFTFQIGAFAARAGMKGIHFEFSPLKSDQGVIPAEAIRCINVTGVDWLGRPFDDPVDVAKSHVQPLWIGVQVPKDAAPGVYEGTMTVLTMNASKVELKLSLTVTDKVLEDAGDSDLWRQSRLRWLDSKIGLDDEVFPPYQPVAIDNQTVHVLGRRVHFADSGLFDSIQSTFGYSVDNDKSPPREILAAPMSFTVDTVAGPVAWSGDKPQIVSQSSGAVTWQTTKKAGDMELVCRAKMECDGYVNYRITLRCAQEAELKDCRLEIPLRGDVAKYMMGMGRGGGYRPPKWRWKWDVNCANSQFWIGDVNAGLNCKLKHVDDRWDLFNMKQSGCYRDWSNDGRGGCTIDEEGDQFVARVYTGPRKVTAGDELHFNFGLLITPVKILDKEHWTWRYYHYYQDVVPVDKIAATGAKVINCHQGNELNPYINYPFLNVKAMADYIAEAHAKGLKVKTYYTVRELSNYTAEFWALRSLGREVFCDGSGFRLADQFNSKKSSKEKQSTGDSWLCEHVISNYAPAWHQRYGNGHCDAAIGTTGLSRWHNYYLEGLSWLIKNVGVDGLYLDGIGYDREIMKRLRKVMQRARPGCLIDFHEGNSFSPEYGMVNPANQNMEHFPYIDSLWFGEGFNYNESPDYWLVEIAGIPYGLFGEMLEGGGNPWRGMLYGMTNRLGWGGDPRQIWSLWDDFGIRDARMIGYWDPACPVKTDHKDILATAYVKDGKTTVAVASWARQLVKCKLEIDWKALNLDPAKTKISAREIEGVQSAAEFRPTDAIPVHPGCGWLLILHE